MPHDHFQTPPDPKKGQQRVLWPMGGSLPKSLIPTKSPCPFVCKLVKIQWHALKWCLAPEGWTSCAEPLTPGCFLFARTAGMVEGPLLAPATRSRCTWIKQVSSCSKLTCALRSGAPAIVKIVSCSKPKRMAATGPPRKIANT